MASTNDIFPDPLAAINASIAQIRADLLNDQTLVVTAAGSASTNSLVAFVGGVARNANAIGPNAVPATAYVKSLDGDNTRFYRMTRVSDDWTPDGGTIAQVLYLGANGTIAFTPPPYVDGNIGQEIGWFLPDGGVLIQIGKPIYYKPNG